MIGGRKGSGFGYTGDHIIVLGDQTLGSGYVKGSLVHAKVLIHSPANYAEHWCSLLKRSETPFARCHLAVDPTEYYKVSSSPNTAHSMLHAVSPEPQSVLWGTWLSCEGLVMCVCLSAGMYTHVCSPECTGC